MFDLFEINDSFEDLFDFSDFLNSSRRVSSFKAKCVNRMITLGLKSSKLSIGQTVQKLSFLIRYAVSRMSHVCSMQIK